MTSPHRSVEAVPARNTLAPSRRTVVKAAAAGAVLAGPLAAAL
ncbi:twin-arginine translocation signal domain-containing protein, partial [Streptomyces sp. SID2999]|nr:twin-arginine translocation signal domain-containing protein [Streptomyces sp. SID2999]